MGQHETSIFDFVGLLIPLEAAAVLGVLAYQWRGWPAALVAPVVALFTVLLVAQIVRRLRSQSVPPDA